MDPRYAFLYKLSRIIYIIILNVNRYYPFIFQPIVGGVNNEPEIYELTPFGCVVKKRKYAVTGSGTEFALSALDSEYREGMAEDQAIEVAVKAISSAKSRDLHTGGKAITVVIIDKNGYRTIDEKEVEKYASKIKSNFSK